MQPAGRQELQRPRCLRQHAGGLYVVKIHDDGVEVAQVERPRVEGLLAYIQIVAGL